MTQPIVIRCPNCSQKYRLPPEKIGSKARCRCGQRFTVAGDGPVDEDTVFGWVVAGADPSSQSVLGGTGIVDSPVAAPSAPRLKRSAQHVPEPAVKLRQMDGLGAHFSFQAAQLAAPGLRNSFPKQCVGCGNAHGLNVHLIIWHQKLPDDDPLRIREINHQPIGRLHRLSAYGANTWLEELPKLKNLPEPFNLPFPFFVCSECIVENDVAASIRPAEDGDMCMITINNLEVAAKFFRNNGGRRQAEYDSLQREAEKQKRDGWRCLPTVVRRQISKWYENECEEKFRGFYPDADFSPAEAGKGGLVLTDKRISFHKYASSRVYSLAKGGRIILKPEPKSTTMRIVQKGEKEATVKLDPACADQLLHELRRCGQRWKITGQSRTF